MAWCRFRHCQLVLRERIGQSAVLGERERQAVAGIGVAGTQPGRDPERVGGRTRAPYLAQGHGVVEPGAGHF